MDILLIVLGVVCFILWLVWTSGKGSGVEEAKRGQLETNGSYERQIEELKKLERERALELRAVEAALRDARRHLDALRGRAGPILANLRANKPPWLISDDPYLLLTPGNLRSMVEWARLAQGIWVQIDRLSAQSRRALEEACYAHLDANNAGRLLPVEEYSTPLLQQAVSVLRKRPEWLDINPFEQSSYDFDDLAHWFDELVIYSQSYVVQVAAVEEEMRREKIRLQTRATIENQ